MYKEMKYMSHNLSNFYLFFLLYMIFQINYGINLTMYQFLLWIFWYSLSYSFVYFLNDYYDKDEDLVNNKHNLYLDMKNKKMFFALSMFFPFLWMMISFFISKMSLIFIFLLYFLNFTYSFPKMKFSNKYFLSEWNMFFIYFVKWFLICLYFWENMFLQNNIILFILWSSFACLSLILYKNLFSFSYFPALFFGFMFFISLWLSIVNLKWIFPLFFPLMGMFFMMKNKHKKNIPFWKYQFYYFLYMSLVFSYFYILK